jgi:hypothetical protein
MPVGSIRGSPESGWQLERAHQLPSGSPEAPVRPLRQSVSVSPARPFPPGNRYAHSDWAYASARLAQHVSGVNTRVTGVGLAARARPSTPIRKSVSPGTPTRTERKRQPGSPNSSMESIRVSPGVELAARARPSTPIRKSGSPGTPTPTGRTHQPGSPNSHPRTDTPSPTERKRQPGSPNSHPGTGTPSPTERKRHANSACPLTPTLSHSHPRTGTPTRTERKRQPGSPSTSMESTRVSPGVGLTT